MKLSGCGDLQEAVAADMATKQNCTAESWVTVIIWLSLFLGEGREGHWTFLGPSLEILISSSSC